MDVRFSLAEPFKDRRPEEEDLHAVPPQARKAYIPMCGVVVANLTWCNNSNQHIRCYYHFVLKMSGTSEGPQLAEERRIPGNVNLEAFTALYTLRKVRNCSNADVANGWMSYSSERGRSDLA
jgi:hypothetical protein